MDWFKGKSTGNHRFSHEIWGFPVIFPLNQSIETYLNISQLYQIHLKFISNPSFEMKSISLFLKSYQIPVLAG